MLWLHRCPSSLLFLIFPLLSFILSHLHLVLILLKHLWSLCWSDHLSLSSVPLMFLSVHLACKHLSSQSSLILQVPLFFQGFFLLRSSSSPLIMYWFFDKHSPWLFSSFTVTVSVLFRFETAWSPDFQASSLVVFLERVPVTFSVLRNSFSRIYLRLFFPLILCSPFCFGLYSSFVAKSFSTSFCFPPLLSLQGSFDRGCLLLFHTFSWQETTQPDGGTFLPLYIFTFSSSLHPLRVASFVSHHLGFLLRFNFQNITNLSFHIVRHCSSSYVRRLIVNETRTPKYLQRTAAIKKAQEYKINVITYPANTTHWLQPLDVVILGPFKRRFCYFLDRVYFDPSNQYTDIGKFDRKNVRKLHNPEYKLDRNDVVAVRPKLTKRYSQRPTSIKRSRSLVSGLDNTSHQFSSSVSNIQHCSGQILLREPSREMLQPIMEQNEAKCRWGNTPNNTKIFRNLWIRGTIIRSSGSGRARFSLDWHEGPYRVFLRVFATPAQVLFMMLLSKEQRFFSVKFEPNHDDHISTLRNNLCCCRVLAEIDWIRMQSPGWNRRKQETESWLMKTECREWNSGRWRERESAENRALSEQEMI